MRKEAFTIEHKGFVATAFYNVGQDADIVVTRDGAPHKEFKYPSYRIWNVAAHFFDMVDEILLKERLRAGKQPSAETSDPDIVIEGVPPAQEEPICGCGHKRSDHEMEMNYPCNACPCEGFRYRPKAVLEDWERAVKWLRRQAESMCFANDFRPNQSQSLAEEFSAVRKAGLADGLELAALACDARVAGGYRYGNREAEQCAIAIRALRATPAAPEPK